MLALCFVIESRLFGPLDAKDVFESIQNDDKHITKNKCQMAKIFNADQFLGV